MSKMARKSWIQEKGKLMNIMQKARISGAQAGNIVEKMTVTNCRKLGRWMANNVSKWSERGKNPKTEGRMMIDVLRRRKDVPAITKKKIKKCAIIIGKELSKLPRHRR